MSKDTHQDLFTKEQYKTLAGWGEKMGIVLFTAIIVQNFVEGFQLPPRIALFGFLWAFATYAGAVILLKKSS